MPGIFRNAGYPIFDVGITLKMQTPGIETMPGVAERTLSAPRDE